MASGYYCYPVRRDSRPTSAHDRTHGYSHRHRALERRSTAKLSILFVDGHNQVRSVLAQAQAELVRLWTLNQRGRNLFSRLDSAGLRVSSPLTRRGRYRQELSVARRSHSSDALDVLLRDGQEEAAAEREDVRHRLVHRQRSRGVVVEDFEQFDYIFCFEEADLHDLRDLRRVAATRRRDHWQCGLKAKLRLLGEYSRGGGSRQVFSPIALGGVSRNELQRTIFKIANLLDDFLEDKLDWTPPSRSSRRDSGTFRSRQFAGRKERFGDEEVWTIGRLGVHRGVEVDEEIHGRESRVVTVTARSGRQLSAAHSDAWGLFGR